ncbi:non-specific lipid-transfer protein-like [Pecten maximus]|uniref:non-specific lipid-transfer protein-like n=1 Tax=Pecten maximus TaxID=6579 RepID=UPI001458E02A|nr:non-specific lipid-transfer protein-like [Pecten maximus]
MAMSLLRNKMRTFVVGVGVTKFEKPMTKAWDYPDMGKEAGEEALKDAGLPYNNVKAVVASYCYGEPTSGQRAVYNLGLSGVPIFNVNNNCSSGSSALMLARRLVQSGMEDCVMALGFEKMERGLSEKYTDRTSPVKRHMDHMVNIGAEPGLIQPRLNQMTSDVVKLYAYAAREYLQKYPYATLDDMVEISYKNHKQSLNNPKAAIQRVIPRDDIKTKIPLCDPITFWMSAPTADGGAAAIVCNEDFVVANNLQHHAVEIIAQHMVTDMDSSFGRSFQDLSGYGMAKEAAKRCYQDSGLTPDDVDVLEVHDCFSCNELFMYEALQLAQEGKGVDLIRNGKWFKNKNGGEMCKLGGKWVVNPSGGLESKGHPIGATGLAQCAELVSQLRGTAKLKQVDGAKVGLQHNFGIGGAAVVTMYQRPGQLQKQSKL